MSFIDPAFGIPKAVSLIYNTETEQYEPLTGAADDGAGGGSLLFMQLKQPVNDGSVSLKIPSGPPMDDTRGSDNGGSPDMNGLACFSVAYGRDPETVSFGTTQFVRTTAGDINANPLVANRRGMDIRAWLYALDAATSTQGVRMKANNAGNLQVSGAGPNSITSVADQTLSAGTAASIIAAAASTVRERNVFIQNLDTTNAIRVGDASITTTRGIRIAAGSSATISCTAQMYAIEEGGTPSIAVNSTAYS